MNIVFLGSGAFALPTLERLSAEHTLLAIVTQPDRPAGRRRALTPTPVGAWAGERRPDVPLIKPESVNEADVRERIRTFDCGTPDDRRGAWVVIAFGQKLSPALLEGRFAINLHASLLPRWRGAAPINHAILAGDSETGDSVITLAERMDAGLILGQSHRPIEPSHTAGELHDLLAGDGPPLVAGVLDAYARGTLEPVEQDPARVTLAPKLSKGDGRLDPSLPAAGWRARIHGLNPWPGVTGGFRGEPLRLLRGEVVHRIDAGQGGEAGRIVDAGSGVVACGEGTMIRLIEVQQPGGRPLAWGAFARGARVEDGERLTEPPGGE